MVFVKNTSEYVLELNGHLIYFVTQYVFFWRIEM